MNSLINSMLDYTRLEQSAERYPFTPLNLSEICESISADMKLIRRNNIELQYDIAAGIFINGNKLLLERALQNLIDNAYKYGKENGHIFVRLKKNENIISLSVKDDGNGIAEDDRELVFDRFFRSDKSRSRENGAVSGNGLGLSMVKKIAEMHGGSIKLECPKDGGCVFTISLLSASSMQKH